MVQTHLEQEFGRCPYNFEQLLSPPVKSMDENLMIVLVQFYHNDVTPDYFIDVCMRYILGNSIEFTSVVGGASLSSGAVTRSLPPVVRYSRTPTVALMVDPGENGPIVILLVAPDRINS